MLFWIPIFILSSTGFKSSLNAVKSKSNASILVNMITYPYPRLSIVLADLWKQLEF